MGLGQECWSPYLPSGQINKRMMGPLLLSKKLFNLTAKLALLQSTTIISTKHQENAAEK